jgi:DNA-binding MarR family transcriptional regulator
MSKDRHVLDSLQADLRFSAADARAAGITPTPIALTRQIGPAAETLGKLIPQFRAGKGKIITRQDHLARWCGISVSTLRNHLAALADAGYVARDPGEPHESNTYRLLHSPKDILDRGFWPVVNYTKSLPWLPRITYALIVFRAELSQDGRSCRDGLRSMAKDLGVTPNGVRRALGRLVTEGLIAREFAGETEKAWYVLLAPSGVVNSSAIPHKGDEIIGEGGGDIIGEGVVNSSANKKGSVKEKCKNHKLAFGKTTKTTTARRVGHIEREDLTDPGRLRALFGRMVASGLVDGSENGWVIFRSAARHALRTGKNPAALLATNIRNGHLFSTQADEQATTAPPRRSRPIGAEDAETEPVTAAALFGGLKIGVG